MANLKGVRTVVVYGPLVLSLTKVLFHRSHNGEVVTSKSVAGSHFSFLHIYQTNILNDSL